MNTNRAGTAENISDIQARSENRICYFLVCFKSVEYVSFLLSSIFRPEDLYLIHCDAKGSEDIKQYLRSISETYENIVVLDSAEYSWAGYSHVDLVLRSMEHALSLNGLWSHFITLSEQHLPLRGPDAIARSLTPGRSMMRLTRATAMGAHGLSDIVNRFSSVFRELPGVGCFATKLRHYDGGFFNGIYHGSNWNVIARNHCTYLLDFESEGGFDIYKTIVHAEEIAIQTILGDRIDEVDQVDSTVVAQPHLVDNHSLVMTDNLFMASVKSESFFIRKRQQNLSDQVISFIKSNHYCSKLYIPSKDSQPEASMRGIYDEGSDNAKWIFDAAVNYFRKYTVTLQRLDPSDICPRLYLILHIPEVRENLCVRVLSENLRDFKVGIFHSVPFDEWNAHADDDFVIATGRCRIHSLFGSDDILPTGLPDAGFISISLRNDIDRLFDLCSTAIEYCKLYENKLSLVESSYRSKSMISSGGILKEIQGVWYTSFLQEYTNKNRPKNYFEIGVNAGESMHFVACETAVGVDPNFILQHNIGTGKKRVFLYQETSDDFFKIYNLDNILEGKVDFAFLDGMHLFEYLLRDFLNIEKYCDTQSVVLLHDCLPPNYDMTVRDQHAPRTDAPPYNGMWTGDVWKIIPILQRFRPDLNIKLIDCAPTGLVAISNLDPNSRVLSDHYESIVGEYSSTERDIESITRLYQENTLFSGQEILNLTNPRIFN